MKYKIGDKVVVKEGNIEYIRPVAGRVGIILAYNSYTDNYLVEFDDGLKIWCDIKGYAPNKQKIVITTDGKITTAKLFENRQLIKAVEAKCHPEDTFDFNVGAKLAVERLTKVEEASKYYNGKVVCVKNATAGFTIGKIYNIVDGVLLDDDGSQRPFPGMDYRIKSADEVYITHKFIPLVGD